MDRLIEYLKEIIGVVDRIAETQNTRNDAVSHFYPPGIDRNLIELELMNDPEFRRFDTLIRQRPEGGLFTVPYHIAYAGFYAEIIHLLDKACRQADDESFRKYLESIRSCLRKGTPESYREMMRAWVLAREYPLCFPFVFDETYCDTLLGVKGSFDAALFQVDPDLTRIVQKPLETWADFVRAQNFPGKPDHFPCHFTRVYRTIALGGSLPAMQLRAWNLPNDYQLRANLCAHQIIILETTRKTFDSDLMPMIRRLFRDAETSDQTRDLYFTGLLRTLTAHELGHNLGCYPQQNALWELEDVFEELKANIFPIQWAVFCLNRGDISREEASAAIRVYLALDLMDCILAKNSDSRKSYCTAAMIQMNYLHNTGCLRIENGRLNLDFQTLYASNATLLSQVLSILETGDYQSGKALIQTFGHMTEFSPLLFRNAVA